MRAHLFINRIENLEPRLLLASFASLNAAGVLSVVGNSNNNVINVVYSLDKVKVTRDGLNLYFDKTKVKKIWAEGFGGNDKITNGVPLDSTLIGDAGNDTLVGNSKSDWLVGGDGDDVLRPGDGPNAIDHGTGNDVIDYSNLPPGDFSLDTFPNRNGTAFLVHGAGALGGADIIGNTRATVLLTPGDDEFFGFGDLNLSTDLVIDAGAGNDHLSLEGHVQLVHSVTGGAGSDTIDLKNRDNVVNHIAASVSGGPGDDYIHEVNAMSGPIACDGGPGHDYFVLSFRDDYSKDDKDVTVPPGIEGFETTSDGKLVIHGNDLDNNITGTAAKVKIYGNGGNDLLKAFYDSNGLLDGGSGNDTMWGWSTDRIVGGPGADVFESGIADYSARTDNLTITLDIVANDGAPNEHDNVMPYVNVNGGSGNDKITGSSSNNILHGGKGNDSLYGSGGADALFGDEGNDVLDGGTGNDYLQGWTGNDALFGRDGNDKLDAGDGNDYLEGNAGYDTLNGSAGDDKLYGGASNDTLDGGSGRDLIFGQDGNDRLLAKDGRTDSLDGGSGFDTAQRDKTAAITDQVLNIEAFA